jgi:hypothetical protein
MITIPELASEALGSHLAAQMSRRYGSTDGELIEIVQSAARLAIDCIGNSDALYHNVEHTFPLKVFVPSKYRSRRASTIIALSVSRHRLCSWHS